MSDLAPDAPDAQHPSTETSRRRPGRIVAAPALRAGAPRREFLRRVAALSTGAVAVGFDRVLAQDSTAQSPPGVPAWSKTLGAPILAHPYGQPSRYEENVRRRGSPGLTRTPHSSVAFTPLQNLFGIITPSGVHFERHHAGVPDVDPHQRRLMVHGMVREPRIFSVDDVMRFPSVSRIHFIEAAPTRAWNGATWPCRECNTRTACSPAASGPACCCRRFSTSSASTRRRRTRSPKAPMALRSPAPFPSGWRWTTSSSPPSPAELARKAGCMACHAVATKLVGPAFREVAARYAGDGGAHAKLLQKIRTGGSGGWGDVPMPPRRCPTGMRRRC